MSNWVTAGINLRNEDMRPELEKLGFTIIGVDEWGVFVDVEPLQGWKQFGPNEDNLSSPSVFVDQAVENVVVMYYLLYQMHRTQNPRVEIYPGSKEWPKWMTEEHPNWFMAAENYLGKDQRPELENLGFTIVHSKKYGHYEVEPQPGWKRFGPNPGLFSTPTVYVEEKGEILVVSYPFQLESSRGEIEIYSTPTA